MHDACVVHSTAAYGGFSRGLSAGSCHGRPPTSRGRRRPAGRHCPLRRPHAGGPQPFKDPSCCPSGGSPASASGAGGRPRRGTGNPDGIEGQRADHLHLRGKGVAALDYQGSGVPPSLVRSWGPAEIGRYTPQRLGRRSPAGRLCASHRRCAAHPTMPSSLGGACPCRVRCPPRGCWPGGTRTSFAWSTERGTPSRRATNREGCGLPTGGHSARAVPGSRPARGDTGRDPRPWPSGSAHRRAAHCGA